MWNLALDYLVPCYILRKPSMLTLGAFVTVVLPVVCVCVCVCLQAKHAVAGNMTWGVDGDTGCVVDMTELGVWDPLSVKVQTYKTAIEVSMHLERGGGR